MIGTLRRGNQKALALLAGAALLAMGVAWWAQRDRLADYDQASVAPAAFVVDVNSAQWVELAQLPGVGETLARRIIEYREQHGPYRSIEQLQQVRGIGSKTYEKLAEHLSVAPAAPGLQP